MQVNRMVSLCRVRSWVYMKHRSLQLTFYATVLEQVTGILDRQRQENEVLLRALATGMSSQGGLASG